ncbi:MAG TPA: type II CAAX endopeptidase family protein [Humibacter sp.]|nr:type II CAAX endopeptidase family protein [Humibacter sp.]
MTDATAVATTAGPQRPGAARRILRFPITWTVIGVALIVLVDALATGIGASFGAAGTAIGALIGGAAAVPIYLFAMRTVGGRAVPELSRHQLGRNIGIGLAIGTAFIVVSVAAVALLGGFTIVWHPVGGMSVVFVGLAVNLGGAIVEELVFRGLILQAILASFRGSVTGRIVAVAVTAALFGGAHMLNPGATVWTGTCIAIEAGVLLAVAFFWRGNLWLVIAIHFAWNFIEGLLGIAVSGHRDPGLFFTTARGPLLLTGGTFGVEASLIPVLLSAAMATVMVLAARKRAARTGAERG